MMYDDVAILVFAKAPIQGEVNTRLIPDIGVGEATKLQKDLIHQRLGMLEQSDICSTILMCSPNTLHDCFVDCKNRYNVTLKQQEGSDLGVRMMNAGHEVLKEYNYCIIVGTDAPTLDKKLIVQAIDQMKSGTSVVFVPAEDGGYVLIGVKQAYGFLFKDISWGSDTVMQQSRNLLTEKGIAFKELATCWDIDRVEDYQRYLALNTCMKYLHD